MKFKTGQYLVYPGHGIAKVERIESKTILGSKRQFYVVRATQSRMVIMIPCENAEIIGVRTIASKALARKALYILTNKPKIKFGDTWAKRYREYMDQIKTGDLLDIALVHAAIVHFKADHELSFGERKMLDISRNLLVEEISLALNMDHDETMSLIAEAG